MILRSGLIDRQLFVQCDAKVIRHSNLHPSCLQQELHVPQASSCPKSLSQHNYKEKYLQPRLKACAAPKGDLTRPVWQALLSWYEWELERTPVLPGLSVARTPARRKKASASEDASPAKGLLSPPGLTALQLQTPGRVRTSPHNSVSSPFIILLFLFQLAHAYSITLPCLIEAFPDHVLVLL